MDSGRFFHRDMMCLLSGEKRIPSLVLLSCSLKEMDVRKIKARSKPSLYCTRCQVPLSQRERRQFGDQSEVADCNLTRRKRHSVALLYSKANCRMSNSNKAEGWVDEAMGYEQIH